MAFEMLKMDYKDDILNTSVNQLRRYTIVNNADGTISLIDSTAYSTVGTFIGAKDINLICKNVNTIMGYIETDDGDLTQEFQEYFAEQQGIFEDNVETYMQSFKNSSQSQFTVWYNASTAAWSQEVNNRINAIVASLTALVNDNGPFVLNKAYKVGNLLTWNIGDGITRGYLVINPVPANMGIYPTNETYFMNVTREGAQGVGLGMTPRGNWRSIITYVENDWVVHNWIYWRCKVENTDSEPSESNANWEKIYDITAEMPIQFYELEENSSSFLETLSNIVSGQTLGNLFKYIKAALLKMLNKFKDTEYTATGTSITYDTSNYSKAIITRITGVTTVIRPNMGVNVSPDNLQTFTDAKNFTVTANNGSGTSNFFTYTGKLGALTEGSSIVNTIEYVATTRVAKLVERWKDVELSGTENWSWLGVTQNKTTAFLVNIAAMQRASFQTDQFQYIQDTSDVEHVRYGTGAAVGDLVVYINKNRLNGWNDSLTAPQKLLLFKSWLEETPLTVRYELITPKETVLSISTILKTYEGTTNITTNAIPQVTLEVEFKSRFWDLNNRMINAERVTEVIDLDNYVEVGRYWLDNDIGSAPIMDTAWLTVKNDVISSYQPYKTIIYQHLESALTTEVWYRYGTVIVDVITWGAWKRVLTSADIANNFLTTNSSMALGADMGKALNDRLDVIGNTISYTNSAFNLPVASTWYDISTNITIPESGLYLVIIQSNWVSTNVTNGRITVRGYINNTTEVSRLIYDGNTSKGTFTTQAFTVITLSAGTLFKVRGWVDSAIANTANSLNVTLTRLQ